MHLFPNISADARCNSSANLLRPNFFLLNTTPHFLLIKSISFHLVHNRKFRIVQIFPRRFDYYAGALILLNVVIKPLCFPEHRKQARVFGKPHCHSLQYGAEVSRHLARVLYIYFLASEGTVYLLCPLNPRMLAFILFTHQYYISTKALRAAFKPLCRGPVLKCTPYCERGARQGIAGPWTPITRHKSVSLFNYIQAFRGTIFTAATTGLRSRRAHAPARTLFGGEDEN